MSESETTTIYHIPEELWTQMILTHLDPKSIINASATCKMLNKYCKDTRNFNNDEVIELCGFKSNEEYFRITIVNYIIVKVNIQQLIKLNTYQQYWK